MARPDARAVAALLTTGVLLLSSCASSPEDGAQAVPESADATPTSTPSGDDTLSMVVLGDSIPNNSPEDCPGCTGFVDRYAAALEEAAGMAVEVNNGSQHTGLTLEGLMASLSMWEQDLAEADVILVAIAHNSSELAAEEPCGAPLVKDMPDWRAVDRACAVSAAERYRPMYDELFADVAALREGEPTVLRTVDRYNDWIGWEEGGLTVEQERRTALVLTAWNEMICTAAEAHGFECAGIGAAFNGPNGLEPSGELLAGDYTHPSDEGNAVIGRELVALGFAPLA